MFFKSIALRVVGEGVEKLTRQKPPGRKLTINVLVCTLMHIDCMYMSAYKFSLVCKRG